MTSSPGGLTCSEVLARLSDHLDGELPAAERAAVDAHLATCANCAQFGGTVAVVLQGLRAQLGAGKARADDVDAGAAARLADALRKARGGG